MVSSGLHPAAKEWLKTSQDECNENGHFRGVGLSKADIIATIKERAAKHSLSTLYLATDGWIRGAESLALLKEVSKVFRTVSSSSQPHCQVSISDDIVALPCFALSAGCSVLAQAGPQRRWVVEHSGPS